MSIIIRLQNLPWTANSIDIRRYFQGQTIPDGGVHIVGGENGDAFIAFATDEDGRQAMEKDGGKIKDERVKLLLSSRAEMLKVIEQARNQSVAVQPPTVAPAVPKPLKEAEKRRSSSDRGRSRSPDRGRSRSPDRGHSRSPDRRRERDKSPGDRDRSRRSSRRDRSRSRSPRRSRDADRYSDRTKRDDRRRPAVESIRKQDEDSRVLPSTHIPHPQNNPNQLSRPLPNGEMVSTAAAFPVQPRNSPPPSRYPEVSTAARPPYDQNTQYSVAYRQTPLDRSSQWVQTFHQPDQQPERSSAPWESSQAPEASRPAWDTKQQLPDTSRPPWESKPLPDANRPVWDAKQLPDTNRPTWDVKQMPDTNRPTWDVKQQLPDTSRPPWDTKLQLPDTSRPPWETKQIPDANRPAWDGKQLPDINRPTWDNKQLPDTSRPAWDAKQPPDTTRPNWDNKQLPDANRTVWDTKQPPDASRPAWDNKQLPDVNKPVWGNQLPEVSRAAWDTRQPPQPQQQQQLPPHRQPPGNRPTWENRPTPASVPPAPTNFRPEQNVPPVSYQGEQVPSFHSDQAHPRALGYTGDNQEQRKYDKFNEPTRQRPYQPSSFARTPQSVPPSTAPPAERGLERPRHEGPDYMMPDADVPVPPPSEEYDRTSFPYPENASSFPSREYEGDSTFPFPPHPPRGLGNNTRPPPDAGYETQQQQGRPAPVLPGFCTELRGLPYNVTIRDIQGFLRGVYAPRQAIKLLTDENGYGNGVAVIKFSNEADMIEALNRNKQYISGRCIEIVQCPESAYENAPVMNTSGNAKYPPSFAYTGMKPKEEDLCIMLKGLPYECKKNDIIRFFHGLDILDIVIEYDRNNRAMGTGFVEFRTFKDFHAAMAINGCVIGNRYIELSVASKEMMAACRQVRYPPQDTKPHHQGPPRPGPPFPLTSDIFCAALSGLPPNITDRDIADFFGETGVVPRAIHIMLKADGLPSGEAFAEFHNSTDFERSLKKAGHFMGPFCISVKPVSYKRMKEILDGPASKPEPILDRPLSDPREHPYVRPGAEATDKRRYLMETPTRIPGRPLLETISPGAANSPGPRFMGDMPEKGIPTPPGRVGPIGRGHLGLPEQFDRGMMRPGQRQPTDSETMDVCETDSHLVETVPTDVQGPIRPMGPEDRPLLVPDMDRSLRPLDSVDRNEPRSHLEYPDRYSGRPYIDSPDRAPGRPLHEPLESDMDPHSRHPNVGNRRLPRPGDPMDPRMGALPGRPPAEPSERGMGGPPGRPSEQSERRGGPLLGRGLMEPPDRRGGPGRFLMDTPSDRRGHPGRFPMESSERRGRFQMEPPDRRGPGSFGRPPMEPDMRGNGPFGRPPLEPPERRDLPGVPPMESLEARDGGSQGVPLMELPDRREGGPPPKRPLLETVDRRVGGPLGRPLANSPDRRLEGPPGRPFMELPDRRFDDPSGRPFMELPDRRIPEPLDIGKRFEDPSGRPYTEPPDRRMGEALDRRFDEPSGRPFMEPLLDRRFEQLPGRPFVESSDRRINEPPDRAFEEPGRPFIEPPEIRIGDSVEAPGRPFEHPEGETPGRPFVEPPSRRLEDPAEGRQEESKSRTLEGQPSVPFVQPPERNAEEPPARPFVEPPDKKPAEQPARLKSPTGRPTTTTEGGRSQSKFSDRRPSGSVETFSETSDKTDLDSRRHSTETRNTQERPSTQTERETSSSTKAPADKNAEKSSSRSSSSSREKHHEKSSSGDSSSKGGTSPSKRTHEASERESKSDRSHSSSSGKSHSSSSSKSHSSSGKSHSSSSSSRTNSSTSDSKESGKKSSDSKDKSDKGKSSESSHRTSSKGSSSSSQKSSDEKSEEKSKDSKSSSSGEKKSSSISSSDQDSKRSSQHFGRSSYSRPEMDPRQGLENHGHSDRALRGPSSFRPPQSERSRGMQGSGQEGFGKPGCIVQGRNIHFQAGADELLKFIGDPNLTKDSIIRRYTDFGQPTGDVRIAFRTPMDAQRAVRELNMAPLRGRPVSLFLI